MPVRPVNADLRKREYLTPHEIEKLIKAASKSGKTEAQCHPRPGGLPARSAGAGAVRSRVVTGRLEGSHVECAPSQER
jgi:hypothetical protein